MPQLLARTCVLVFALLFVHTYSASAQTISGTVTDATGGVLPGVTVEASSPALIEQTRTAVSNEAGRYSIVNLRPGTYTVTFTLGGFNTVRREGVQLTSDFTAQVNAQLAVGGVQETVTVQSASPVVDVEGVANPTIMTRDVMDALPTGRTPQALSQTIPGVSQGNFNQINYRGSLDSLTTVDGMRTTFMVGAGPSNSSATFSNGMFQEFSFSTAIDSAEMGQPGLRINLVPKDGGNQFRGSFYTIYSRDSFQTSNLDDGLVAQGITAQAQTLKEWDVNPSFGGPIIRDKLWFQGTGRYNGTHTQVLNSFFDRNADPFVYEADPSAPAIDERWGVSGNARLTWQATSKDKIAGFLDRSYSEEPFFRSGAAALANPPESTLSLQRPNNQNIGVRWTRTHSSRLLFEVGASTYTVDVLNDFRGPIEAWSGQYVDAGLPTGAPAQFAILDQSNNRQIGVPGLSDANISSTSTASGAATYVTGSHSFKTGVTFFHGTQHRMTAAPGYATLTINNGRASTATLSLPGNERETIDGDWAFYAQDRWTVKRLTMNLGLRMDWLTSSIPAQRLPVSPWLGETLFEPMDVLDWKDLSPRLGAAYDLFGNGKTAVKVALARYVAGETVGLTGQANPIRTIATTDSRQWTDVDNNRSIYNANGTVQFSELGPTGNANFGRSVVNTTFDEDVLRGWFKRGYSWETNVSVQHELVPGMAVSALYYRRTVGNHRTSDNTRNSPSDYTGPFCVTGPSDPRLPNGGGQQICGLFDITPAARPLVQNFNTFATDLGADFRDITDGYELTVNGRLPRGAFLQGGLNLQRVLSDRCDVIDNPQVLNCLTESPFRPDIKISGSYPLPFAIQVAGTYQGLRGPELLATWNAPNSVIAPVLGRNLAQGTNATKSIPLMDPDTTYLSMRHIFDMRFSKTFAFDRFRFQALADLYNIFNTNETTTVITTFGNNPATNTWQRTTGIVAPRILKLGAQIDF